MKTKNMLLLKVLLALLIAMQSLMLFACGTDTGLPVIHTKSLPDAVLNVQYSQTLEAAGAKPVVWNITAGALPDGLELSAAGLISGIPSVQGAYSFTAKAENTDGAASVRLSIVVSKEANTASVVNFAVDGTATTITVKNVVTNPIGKAVQYAVSKTDAAPATGWRNSPLFTELDSDETYYVFVRVSEEVGFAAGAPSASKSVKTSDAPYITGPKYTDMVQQGYKDMVVDGFSFGGFGVTKVTQDTTHGGKIIWDNAERKLNIAAGLGAGTHTVTLTASNGLTELDDATLTFHFNVTDLSNNVLSSFDNDGYSNLAESDAVLWRNFPVTFSMTADEAASGGKALKVSEINHSTTDTQHGFVVLYFAEKGVLRSQVENIKIRFRTQNCLNVINGVVVRLGTAGQNIGAAEGGYTTVTVNDLTVLDAMADSDGYMHRLGIHFISKSADVDGDIFIDSISYTPKHDAYMDDTLQATDTPQTGTAGTYITGTLAAFDKEDYLANVLNDGSWVQGAGYAVQSSIVDDVNASGQKALKITKNNTSSMNGYARIYFARADVLRSNVTSVSVRLRIDNYIQQGGGNIRVRLGENPVSQFTLSGDEYQTITVSGATMLDAMSQNGYMRSLGIEFLSAGAGEQGSIYVDNITYSTELYYPYLDDGLRDTDILAAFDNNGYQANVLNDGSWTQAADFRVIGSIVDDADATGGKAIQITKENISTRDGWARIYFGRSDVAREDVASITIRLRLDDAIRGDAVNIQMRLGETPNMQFKVMPGTGYTTILISNAAALDAMATAGFMHSLGIQFSSAEAAVNGSIFIDSITFARA